MTDAGAHVADLLQRWEQRSPGRVALRFGEQSWSWRDLSARVRRNAAAQRAAGLAEGDRVAFLDKNHPACLETTLACAYAGTVNAVVNARLAPDELSYVLNDSAAKVLFVGAELLPALEGIRDELKTVERVIVVGGAETDEYEAFLAGAGEPDGTERADATLDDCFLQLYTSGTTGYPKGAMLTHRCLLAHSEAAAKGFGFTADSVNLVAMPLFHVGGTSWALAGMSVGCETVLVRDVVPADVLATIAAHRVTHAFFVPAVIGFLLRVPGVREADVSTLRCLGYGGSPMPAAVLSQAMDVFDVDFYQVYGMTEAAGVFCILGPDDHRAADHPEWRSSVGRPVDGVEMRVVDPVSGTVLGDGELGEFQIRGEQVMAGYWGRAEDTAATIADGWLRTGDAGRRDEHGYFSIEDRVKDMIISGGENIYPAEVERVLAEFPGIAEVAVIGVPDATWGEQVKAVVVPSAAAPDPDDAIAFCRDRLAGYKCPSTVDVVAELPRNATGKILKRTLREPYWEGRQRAL
ncbi:long-chain fatty acid--CoA ligase [Prauserella marina]|uniref:Acyl-CoA synthetase (AMP-forming)/AMP-acid ligase II n=1 Tax=Prauserella marina TaxID=530584 RepID=A0A222VN49_9PSEU|nr:long-chain-fatty-acid--CoA ligase [Prauserella marina]ASR35304.1 long-chain fatty acid--CoA ligase [Prauserella marina]PWV84916.1 acyl-CoA synthetase (AMP-forming)/AMP-acid ligase II [Prauserella marina]SDC09550.1 Acyl-CoA synthetase (AMP-forming)/AMP-acid ligase II [Prauserella marina]